MANIIQYIKNIKIKLRFNKQHKIPAIRLHGVIMNDDNKISLKSKIKDIDKAFKMAKDVVFLSINSPGGAPGQSELLYAYITDQATKHNVKVITFIEDYGASGGYWLATIGHEIYCLSTSMVGSIGVITSSFGLHAVLKNYNIERRLFTAGEAKNRNDMFSEMSDDDHAYMNAMLNTMHDVFINHVKKCRPTINPDVFDARVAIGADALEYGLVDGLHTMHSYRDTFYTKREIVFCDKGKFFDLSGFKNFGMHMHQRPAPLTLMK